MAIQVKRLHLDFVARDYASELHQVQILSQNGDPGSDTACYERHVKGAVCTLRCYFSLQGEDAPVAANRPPIEGAAGTEHRGPYRYDWSFGMSLVKDFYWDWMKELPKEGALAIHMVLEPCPFETGPEPIPIAATLSTLSPSRNTKGPLDEVVPMIPKVAAETAKVGAAAVPFLNFLTPALAAGSNLLASQTGSQKNWFLYQFLDERAKCPVVEWRISKRVLVEYGPLIRGALFLTFSPNSRPGTVRMQLRPQIRYNLEDELSYVVPTNWLKAQNPMFIDISLPAA